MGRDRLEARMLERVQPLKGPSQTFNLSELTEKDKKAVLRLVRRELRLQKEELSVRRENQYLRFLERLLIESIRGGAQVIGEGEGAVGEIVGRMVQNPDPVVFGLAAGSSLLALAWFIEAFPRLAKIGHLDILARDLNLGQAPTGDLLNNVAQCAQDDIKKIQDAGLPVPPQLYAIRDYSAKVGPAFKIDSTILNILSPFIPLGPVVQWLIGAANAQQPDICGGLDTFTRDYIAKNQKVVLPPTDITPPGAPSVHGR